MLWRWGVADRGYLSREPVLAKMRSAPDGYGLN